ILRERLVRNIDEFVIWEAEGLRARHHFDERPAQRVEGSREYCQLRGQIGPILHESRASGNEPVRFCFQCDIRRAYTAPGGSVCPYRRCRCGFCSVDTANGCHGIILAEMITKPTTKLSAKGQVVLPKAVR